MTLIMTLGIGWRLVSPAGLTADQTRHVLTTVVYYVFLPALILDVLCSADIDIHSLEISLIGVGSILLTMLIIWMITSIFKFSRSQTGAIILATSFPNVTYLGLPVLEQTFGDWARSVVIQLDFFAASPLLFTVGIMIARHYSEDKGKHKSMLSFFNTPPFWVAFLAVFLNLNHIQIPVAITGILQKLSAAVVPLMLFSLGLALNWKTIKFRSLPTIVPVVVVKLFCMPLIAVFISRYLTLNDEYKTAAILDMAMPSMVIGIIFCDRYKLDSSLYAMTVTVTTLLSIFTLPFWFSQL